MSETMNAVRVHAYGGLDALIYEEIPKPQPGPGQVLVKVLAAGVNPYDTKVRAGRSQETRSLTLPITLGVDIAGVVVAVGEGVTEWTHGDAVYADTAPKLVGYAEYALAKASDLARKPESLTFVEAASLPVAALTAWQGLFDHADLQPGQTVLIHAASGGVGMFAVQFAKWKGATVIGTASAQNEQFVRDLGVDSFIDYHAAPFETVLTEKVDVVYNTVGPEIGKRSLAVLKPGGALVSIAGGPDKEEAAQHEVRAMAFMTKASGKQLTQIGELFDAGILQTHIAAVLPLTEVQAAHQQIETHRTRGKIVLQIGAD